MTVATALAVSWKPFENSKASTRRKQNPSSASVGVEPEARWANMAEASPAHATAP